MPATIKPKKPAQRSLTLKQWLAIPDAPVQRDTARHAKKATYLKTLKPSHLTVHMAITKSGEQFKLDGHTRSYMWENDMTDQPPKSVTAIVYQVEDVDEVIELYHQFDSTGQVKNAADQLCSALKQFHVPMTSKFLQRGTGVVAALKEAYREVCKSRGKTTTDGPRHVALATCVEMFREQLAALDAIDPKTGGRGGPNFKGPVTCAFLLAHYKHSQLKKNVAEVVAFFDAYNKNLGTKIGRMFDPVFGISRIMRPGGGGGEAVRIKRTAQILANVERWLGPHGREPNWQTDAEVDMAQYLKEERALKGSIAQRNAAASREITKKARRMTRR
jgi:hypothetical protein